MGRRQAPVSRTARFPPFAILPRAVIESGLDDTCVRLYAEIVVRSGLPNEHWPVRGEDDLAKRLGMQGRTLMVHARHLESCGLIELRKEGKGKYRFIVIHNLSLGL
jgi:DNA-binding transcriptional ArsR family regulator